MNHSNDNKAPHIKSQVGEDPRLNGSVTRCKSVCLAIFRISIFGTLVLTLCYLQAFGRRVAELEALVNLQGEAVISIQEVLEALYGK